MKLLMAFGQRLRGIAQERDPRRLAGAARRMKNIMLYLSPLLARIIHER